MPYRKYEPDPGFRIGWLTEYYSGVPLPPSNLIMTQYIAARQICFSPATLTSFQNLRRNPEDYPPEERSIIDGWMEPSGRGEIQTLQRQVLFINPDPEATIEYSLRLAIGLDVPVDVPSALCHLCTIIEGPYADTLKAKAASLASACYLDAFTRESFKPKDDDRQNAMAMAMADFSCQLGFFSEIAYYLVEEALLSAPNTNEVMEVMKNSVPHVFCSYQEFINREGLKIAAGRVCSACWKGSVSKSQFSRCAGACEGIRKLSYCSKACQKSRWKVHRTRCTTGSDVRLTPIYMPPALGAVEIRDMGSVSVSALRQSQN